MVEGERECVGRRPRNWKQSYQDTAVAFWGDALDPGRWIPRDKLSRTLLYSTPHIACFPYFFCPHPATFLPRTSPPGRDGWTYACRFALPGFIIALVRARYFNVIPVWGKCHCARFDEQALASKKASTPIGRLNCRLLRRYGSISQTSPLNHHHDSHRARHQEYLDRLTVHPIHAVPWCKSLPYLTGVRIHPPSLLHRASGKK